MKRKVFPFSAVMGQNDIKKTLIWNYINPKIGGVLISGQKGTAKSTLVRASSTICGKEIIELPLNVTEDRLIGAIDFEKAMKYGKKALDKGILYYADDNILYVDEVNLLSENIVKALLEAASAGNVHVEREGISEEYDSRFILIGSMNPEESGLRPQLLDRFGLYVDVSAEENKLVRCEIIRRRLDFEKNPDAFWERFKQQDAEIKKRIEEARERLKKIVVSNNALKIAAELALSSNCQGSRGEIAIVETARAICAWNGNTSVTKDSLVEAAKYALPHRMRDGMPPQPEEQYPPEEKEQEATERNDEQKEEKEEQFPANEQEEVNDTDTSPEEKMEEEQNNDETEEEKTPTENRLPDEDKIDECGEMFEVCKWLDNDNTRLKIKRGNGRRSLVKTGTFQGRYVKSIMGEGADIAFDATIRAAAPYQKTREKNGLAFVIKKSDFRQKVREKRTGSFLVFVVDASGSMGAGKRMTAVKGAVLSLLSDAYQKRDKVAMITFRRDNAEIVLGMTRSIDLAAKKLETLATGGKTPLYAGLKAAHQLVKAAKKKEKDLMPVIILVSDGRATAGKSSKPFGDALEQARAIAADKIKSVVIDVEQDFIKLKLAEKIGEEMNADVYQLSGLHADGILSAVKQAINE